VIYRATEKSGQFPSIARAPTSTRSFKQTDAKNGPACAAGPVMDCGIRISATDWIDGGWTVEESVVFAGELKSLGCDFTNLFHKKIRSYFFKADFNAGYS